ncbi:MAG: RNA-binding transcriptional accessory protein [Ichthyobacteriaceae bacterium]|nr:RNA-binding transcriptional accessory protein [Ichthyobacteriaceae bacterium]
MENTISRIAKQLNIRNIQASSTIELLTGGATIPFIARYRKERTGNLDETVIAEIQKQSEYYNDLAKRKKYILDKINSEKKLTDDLRSQIENTFNSNTLEDIYLPFKSKRKTKAVTAKDNGLEPLAKIILLQNSYDLNLNAKKYINKEIKNTDDAIEGARFIIAEWVSENISIRNLIRNTFERHSKLKSKVVKSKIEEASKYEDYFDYEQQSINVPSHRFLAINRASGLGFLKTSLVIDEEDTLSRINNKYIKGNSQSANEIELAIKDAYKRLLKPSIENEIFNKLKEKSDLEAITVFEKNLSQLLLASPLGQKIILAIDPGFKSGCKVVCINKNGDLLHNETLFPHPPQNDKKSATNKVFNLCSTYKIEAIAIGNGTAGRETEKFVKNLKLKLPIFLISEDGASVYSASKIAREEFPNYDITVRGAVSIGRRLMDPLAELVKIDAKSIGVGQYQHEVNQTQLQNALDSTTISAVNKVGVNLNTAGKHLLSYVSGLGPALAQNIVDYRSENGSFKNRKELLKVPRLGNKAFEQSAGFLRILKSNNALDNSGIHPESYNIVEKIAKSLKVKTSDLLNNKLLVDKIKLDEFITKDIGLPTLTDIKNELMKPGLDPRSILKEHHFDDNINTIKDLAEGMELSGKVVNITNFGAFVDIGIKESGLIHLSNMADRYISDPNEIVELNKIVTVKVISIDILKKRIGLKLLS